MVEKAYELMYFVTWHEFVPNVFQMSHFVSRNFSAESAPKWLDIIRFNVSELLGCQIIRPKSPSTAPNPMSHFC